MPTDEDPQGAPVQQSLHTQYGGPAVDRSGRADCQAGQTGYPDRLVTEPALPAGQLRRRLHRRRQPRGRSTANTPGLAGGTFKARELGIDHVEDVP